MRCDSNRADVGKPCPFAPAMNEFLAQRRALEVADGFHFYCARPVATPHLHKNDVSGRDTDNIEY